MTNSIKTKEAANILAERLGGSAATWLERMRDKRADGTYKSLPGVVRVQFCMGKAGKRGGAIFVCSESLQRWIAQQLDGARESCRPLPEPNTLTHAIESAYRLGSNKLARALQRQRAQRWRME